MTTFEHTVKDPAGIHARPAGMLVKLCKELGAKITITKGDKTAEATKLFGVMGLGVKSGETVSIGVEGENEAQAAQQLQAFLQENL